MNDHLVPKKLMIPLGAQATQDLGKCADNWTDSEVANLRAKLPPEYHAVPLDSLRRQWIGIRKSGKHPEYRVGGHGPAKGSRTLGLSKLTKEQRDYIASPEWAAMKEKHGWIKYWERCCICYRPDNLDVHHRTYERMGHEDFKDCIVLCRRCHDWFHEHDKKDKKKKKGKDDQGELFGEA